MKKSFIAYGSLVLLMGTNLSFAADNGDDDGIIRQIQHQKSILKPITGNKQKGKPIKATQIVDSSKIKKLITEINKPSPHTAKSTIDNSKDEWENGDDLDILGTPSTITIIIPEPSIAPPTHPLTNFPLPRDLPRSLTPPMDDEKTLHSVHQVPASLTTSLPTPTFLLLNQKKDNEGFAMSGQVSVKDLISKMSSASLAHSPSGLTPKVSMMTTLSPTPQRLPLASIGNFEKSLKPFKIEPLKIDTTQFLTPSAYTPPLIVDLSSLLVPISPTPSSNLGGSANGAQVNTSTGITYRDNGSHFVQLNNGVATGTVFFRRGNIWYKGAHGSTPIELSRKCPFDQKLVEK